MTETKKPIRGRPKQKSDYLKKTSQVITFITQEEKDKVVAYCAVNDTNCSAMIRELLRQKGII